MAIVCRQEKRCDSKSYCALLTDIKYGRCCCDEPLEAESSGRQLSYEQLRQRELRVQHICRLH